jgi:hypothetical protein
MKGNHSIQADAGIMSAVLTTNGHLDLTLGIRTDQVYLVLSQLYFIHLIWIHKSE